MSGFLAGSALVEEPGFVSFFDADSDELEPSDFVSLLSAFSDFSGFELAEDVARLSVL